MKPFQTLGPVSETAASSAEAILRELGPQVVALYRQKKLDGEEGAAVVFHQSNVAQVGLMSRKDAADEVDNFAAAVLSGEDCSTARDIAKDLRTGRGHVPGCLPCAFFSASASVLLLVMLALE